MNHATTAFAVLLAGAGAVLPAQGLLLSGTAGSYPGTLQVGLAPGPVGRPCALLWSTTSGPTPLALADPTDPRVIYVGTELLGVSFFGVFLPPGQFTGPALPVPNLPSLLDFALYFQGFDFPGTQYAIGRVSNPAVARFAPQGTWRDRGANVTITRTFASVLPDGAGSWMVTGGGGSGGIAAPVAVKRSEVYDAINDTWVPGPDMVSERVLHTATELQDGRWLLCGGLDPSQSPHARCEIWDPATQQFSQVASMAFPRAGHQATRLPDGRVLVTGGFDANTQPGSQLALLVEALVETEIYDPAANTWTRGPDMTVPRIQHAHLALPDGRILIVGGAGWIRILIKIPALFADCDYFDPATGAITPGPAMSLARGGFSAIEVAPGRFLCAGGGKLDLANPGAPTAEAELFDAATGTWARAGNMTQARALHQAFALPGGKFLHVGGTTGTLDQFVALDSTDVYDVATGQWSAGPRMPIARAAPAAFVTPLGQIQLVSGEGPGQQALSSSVLFYP